MESSPKSAPPKPNDALSVGKVQTTHGVKGYLKVQPLGDYPERLEEIERMYCQLADETWIELHPEDVQVRSGSQVLIKFQEFDSPEAAAVLRNRLLEVPRKEIPPLEPGHYYYADMIGLTAVSTDGCDIGVIEDVYEAGNVLLGIRTNEGRELLIPWVDAFVKEIDLNAGIVRIEPIPGLLDDSE